jgi:hypothetical protein
MGMWGTLRGIFISESEGVGEVSTAEIMTIPNQ